MRSTGLLTVAVLGIVLVGRWVVAATQPEAAPRSAPIEPFLMMTQVADLVAQHGVDYTFGQ